MALNDGGDNNVGGVGVTQPNPIVEFRGLPPLIPRLQYVNRLVWEICSGN